MGVWSPAPVDFAPTSPGSFIWGQQHWLKYKHFSPPLLHLSFPATLWDRLYDCAHFTDEKTDGRTEVTQLRNRKARRQMDAGLPVSTAPAHPCSAYRVMSEPGWEEIQSGEREDNEWSYTHPATRNPWLVTLYLGSLLEIPNLY